jgi:hypothetical protein
MRRDELGAGLIDYHAWLCIGKPRVMVMDPKGLATD